MMLSPSDLLVPKPLFGTYVNVKRNWQRITRRALKEGTWKNVLEDMDYLTLEERPEDILINHPARFRGPGEFWQMCVVHDLIISMKLEPPENHTSRICALNWDGLRYPWFVLSAFCSQGAGLPAGEAERKRFALHALPIVMEWWDCFCLLDERFRHAVGRGWPNWAFFLGDLLVSAGLSHDFCRPVILVPPKAAGQMIRNWMEDGVIPGLK